MENGTADGTLCSGTFEEFSTAATRIGSGPFDYQRRLAEAGKCYSRLINIPTGLGGNCCAGVLPWLCDGVALNRSDRHLLATVLRRNLTKPQTA